MASPGRVIVGRFISSLALVPCTGLPRNTSIVSINYNTNFPKLPVVVGHPSLGVAFLSSINGGLAFVGSTLDGYKLLNSVIRTETRRLSRRGRCEREFSLTIDHTITPLGVLTRCYLPFIGPNKCFVTVGNTRSRTRLNAGTVGALKNGVRRIILLGLPGSSAEGLVVVGGVSRASSGCPEGSGGVDAGPLWVG